MAGEEEFLTPVTGNGWDKVKDSVPQLMSLLRCAVCHSVVKDPASLISCGHFFCRDCIVPWLSGHSSCPECGLPAMPMHVTRDDRVTGILEFGASMEALLETPLEVPASAPASPGGDVADSSLRDVQPSAGGSASVSPARLAGRKRGSQGAPKDAVKVAKSADACGSENADGAFASPRVPKANKKAKVSQQPKQRQATGKKKRQGVSQSSPTARGAKGAKQQLAAAGPMGSSVAPKRPANLEKKNRRGETKLHAACIK